jgi:hypothetical protein
MRAADAIRACPDATGCAPAKLWRDLFREVARAVGEELRYQPLYTKFMSTFGHGGAGSGNGGRKDSADRHRPNSGLIH